MIYAEDELWPRPALYERLVEEIYEAVEEAISPGARAVVLSLLIEELCAAVESVHPSVTGPELMGLTKVSVVAADHAVRMNEGPDRPLSVN